MLRKLHIVKNQPKELTICQTRNRRELLHGRLPPHRLLKFSGILNSLPKTEISPKLVSFDLRTPTAEIALGMIWNINQDKLTLKQSQRITLIQSVVFHR